ncbi:type I restriction endonuclease subunit R [Marinifilum sp.]|uniref:type I restriction endonuclease subunit R n=1 Tax=Marinifilum sp. TaxID=2033137 RepID=UPI003BA87500
MHSHTDTSEKGFQKLIVNHLVKDHGFVESYSSDFDSEFALNREQLFAFIEKTQSEYMAYIRERGERKFLSQLDARVKKKGIIEVLRKGVSFKDKTIALSYPLPNSNYNAKDKEKFDTNIFSVTQELIYTKDHSNRIDLTIFLNGLPLLTMELKNAFTHQAVKDAIKQYMNTRSPKDKIFNPGRCMVHFAMDTTQVYMTGTLNGSKTIFFPFNKGLNDGSPYPPFGAGNPNNPNGIKTAYMWEDILTKNSLSNIVEKFSIYLSKEKVQIFPRYHQLKVVRKVLADAKSKGVGQRYLVQHSAGSGKSNSITWLAHQLIGLFDKDNVTPLFDSVLVVTDRTVLDDQIRTNIKAFAQVKRIVEAITGKAKDIKALDPSEDSYSKTTHMRLALANNKKIITCTVQTFPFVLKAIQDMAAKKVAIIIDEAHSSQSGQAAASMNAVFANEKFQDLPTDEEGKIDTEDLLNFLVESRKMLKNASYFAFTATPKNKTLETFGEKTPYVDEYGDHHDKFLPFHTYSMKQAIEEEFIIDVLGNYTTYKSYYKIKENENASGDEEFDTKRANKLIRSYVEGHELAIQEKARTMIDHFNKHVYFQISNKAKAMVVCKSIESAMKYKDAFDVYLKELNSPYKSIVAFSGKKKHYKTGEELTEEKMNAFPDGVNDIPEQFDKQDYRFLIVANKYQTGFDQPLLHTMYVDKQLADVQAVQTLSRLNRAYKPSKKDTFVLDFFNEIEDVKLAFEPYYTTTILSQETDSHKLNDLQDDLDDFQIYEEEQLKLFFNLYHTNNDKNVHRERLDGIIDEIVSNFYEDLVKDEQIDFKSMAKSFVRTYSYLAKLLDFNKGYWEMLWLVLKHLIPFLKIEDDAPDENILEVIDMASYSNTCHQRNVAIPLVNEPGEVNPIPVTIGGGSAVTEYDTLENIVRQFNERFARDLEDFGDNRDEASEILSQNIPNKLKENAEALKTIANSDKTNAKDEADYQIKALIQKLMFTNTGLYKKFMGDEDFRNRYQEFIFEMLWSEVKSNQRLQDKL